MPTRRPSPPAPAVRRTRPARTSRATCLDIAAGDTPSLAASSRTPTPGVRRMETSSVTWPPVTPSGCTSRRSSRASWRSTGRSCVRDGERIGGDGVRGQFVNQVNKTVASARAWLPCPCEVVATITRRQKSLALIRAREVATNLRCRSSSLIPTARSSFTTRQPRRSSETRSSPPAKCRARHWAAAFVAGAGGRHADPHARAAGRASRCSNAPPPPGSLLHGHRRNSPKVAVTAFPLVGREGELFGAFTIFWHI